MKILKYLYQALIKTIDHDGVEHAGYMSFMVLLTIFPFCVFILALTSFVGASHIGEILLNILTENMPEQAIESMRPRIKEIIQSPPQSLMNLAIFGTIWTSSSFVEGLRTILNRIYEISSPPPYILRRLLSIGQFVLISILLIMAVLILVIAPVGLSKIPELNIIIKNFSPFWFYIRYLILFLSLFFSISVLYYVLPNAKFKYYDVFPGALLTSILWIISGILMSKYIIYYHQLSVIYGSLGSIIVTMLFFYIINLLFIYGAEFNYLYKGKLCL